MNNQTCRKNNNKYVCGYKKIIKKMYKIILQNLALIVAVATQSAIKKRMHSQKTRPNFQMNRDISYWLSLRRINLIYSCVVFNASLQYPVPISLHNSHTKNIQYSERFGI